MKFDFEKLEGEGLKTQIEMDFVMAKARMETNGWFRVAVMMCGVLQRESLRLHHPFALDCVEEILRAQSGVVAELIDWITDDFKRWLAPPEHEREKDYISMWFLLLPNPSNIPATVVERIFLKLLDDVGTDPTSRSLAMLIQRSPEARMNVPAQTVHRFVEGFSADTSPLDILREVWLPHEHDPVIRAMLAASGPRRHRALLQLCGGLDLLDNREDDDPLKMQVVDIAADERNPLFAALAKAALIGQLDWV